MNRLLGFALLAASLGACVRATPEFDPAAYEQEILDWRAGRLENLLAPTGYLNQVGLYWLEEGRYAVGSGPDNDIALPASAAPQLGEFEVTADGVRLHVADTVEVLHDGQPVQDLLIASDRAENPVMVEHGSLAMSVVDRDGRLAVRVRDYEHPFVASFGPLPYFEIDSAWRIEATLERYAQPRIVSVGTVIDGLGYHPESPGVVHFEVDGERYELEAYAAGDELFFVFGDETNRDDTYGAGRFLYAALPGDDGRTVLDFNKSYSPPCAFNDFSTCPVASPRNRLPLRITAGEKFDSSLHYSAAAH